MRGCLTTIITLIILFAFGGTALAAIVIIVPLLLGEQDAKSLADLCQDEPSNIKLYLRHVGNRLIRCTFDRKVQIFLYLVLLYRKDFVSLQKNNIYDTY